MTEIERKALELVNEVAQDVRYEPDDFEEERRDVFKALCRAIEQHEAFRQEVSDAVVAFMMDKPGLSGAGITRFIITKPDPLVEVLSEAGYTYLEADSLRAALAKRGLEIREKSNG